MNESDPTISGDITKRAWSLRRKLFVGWLAFLLICAAYAASVWLGTKWSVENRLAEIKKLGQPVTAGDVNRSYDLPEGMNNSTASWMSAMNETLSAMGLANDNVREQMGFRNEIPAPGETWKQFDECRQFIANVATYYPGLYAAADEGGRCRFNVNYAAGLSTRLPDLGRMRGVQRMYYLHAMVRAHEGGKSGEVYRDVLAMFRTSEVVAGEVCLIGFLVRVAHFTTAMNAIEKVMPSCNWSDEQLADLQAELVKFDIRAGFKRAMLCERALLLYEMDRNVNAFVRGDNKTMALDLLDSVLNTLDDPWPDSLEVQEDIQQRMIELKMNPLSEYRYSGVLTYMPAQKQVVYAALEVDARRRLTFLAIAMQRHFLKHGELPVSLDDIDPEFLRDNGGIAMKVDPRDEQPMRFIDATKDDGPATRLIYSVGENGVDDKGDRDRDRIPGMWQTPDIVFEVKTPSVWQGETSAEPAMK